MTDQPAPITGSGPCAGFPDQCPYLLTVDPNLPRHEGGLRCGCNARQDLEDMAFELATGTGVVDPREYKATLDRYASQVRNQHTDRRIGTADPRQPAYDAVFAYICEQPRDFLPTTVVDRNALIWRAVHTALDAMGVPRKEGT